MEKKEDLKEKRFIRTIIILYILVFLLAFSWRLSFYYFLFTSLFAIIGIISLPLFTVLGLTLYPISSFIYSILPKDIGLYPIALSTIYDFAALAGLLILLFVKEKKEQRESNKNDFLTIGFLFLITFLTIYHRLPFSFSNYWYILILVAGLIYFVVSKTLYKKERLRLFIWLFLIVVMSLIFRFSFYAHSFQESFIGQFNNNMFSRDLVFIVPIVIYLFWAEKNKYLKIISLISLAFLVQNIAIMGSRGSWIAIIPVLAIIGMMNIKKEKTIWLFGILAVIFVMTYILTSPEIIREFSSIHEQVPKGEAAEEKTISSRWLILKSGWELFKERPLMGWGPGDQERILYEEKGIRYNTHNSYLEVAISAGFFALSIYIMLFIYSIINCYKAQKLLKDKDQFTYNISWGVLFGLIAIGIDQCFKNRSYAAPVWIGFGLSTALYYIAKNTPQKKKKIIKEKIKTSNNKKITKK